MIKTGHGYGGEATRAVSVLIDISRLCDQQALPKLVDKCCPFPITKPPLKHRNPNLLGSYSFTAPRLLERCAPVA